MVCNYREHQKNLRCFTIRSITIEHPGVKLTINRLNTARSGVLFYVLSLRTLLAWKNGQAIFQCLEQFFGTLSIEDSKDTKLNNKRIFISAFVQAVYTELTPKKEVVL